MEEDGVKDGEGLRDPSLAGSSLLDFIFILSLYSIIEFVKDKGFVKVSKIGNQK